MVALAAAIPNTPVTSERSTGRSPARNPDLVVPSDPSPSGRRRVTRKDQAEIVRLYESGLSCRIVAEQVGVSKAYVLKHLKAAGVQMRPRGSHGFSRQ